MRNKDICCKCKYYDKKASHKKNEPMCGKHTIGKIIDMIRKSIDDKNDIKTSGDIEYLEGIPKECPYVLEQIVMNKNNEKKNK